MAEFEKVFTEISNVNSGNQFGNEVLPASAINVALQNTQALKDGRAKVQKSTTSEVADYLVGESTTITLGEYEDGRRPIATSQVNFENVDKILYSGKWYYITIVSDTPCVICNKDDTIVTDVDLNVPIEVAKSVKPKDVLLSDQKWTSVDEYSSFIVEEGGTYQVAVVDGNLVVQKIFTVIGAAQAYPFAAEVDINYNIYTYYAFITSNYRLYVVRQTDELFGTEQNSYSTGMAFQIRKLS